VAEVFTYAPHRWDGELWDRCMDYGPGAPCDLRIVTWNVWFGGHRFDERRRALLAELGRRRPDVIALQEVTYPLLRAIFDEPWVRDEYQVSDLDVIGYDVVVLARATIRRMRTLALPTEMGRRLAVARLACGLDVATVHLESTSMCARERAEQLAIIQPSLAAASEDVVLVGDMNFEPGAPRETAVLDPSFADVWPELHPGDPGYSIDTERNAMRSMTGHAAQKRIDRVFLRSRRWRAEAIELVGTEPIDLEGTFISDHFGLEVSLRYRA
jgi:endonuclease/exonuclease/phosphatase family metal-dependent hydrolase